METIILHPNATPVYGFLSLIHASAPQNDHTQRKILDCGAGGSIPPLALFDQFGFETWGIDISAEQMEKARQFCISHDIDAHLRLGDMRSLPFENESFDYVYEHYAMCHLNKTDTAVAVCEMQRVLKPGGYCFLGVISIDCWPRSLFGEEREPGEYWGEEGGEQNILHSMFTDREADGLVANWEIVVKEKQVRYLREAAAQMSIKEWIDLYGEAEQRCSAETWREQYLRRADKFQYVHLYYCLKK